MKTETIKIKKHTNINTSTNKGFGAKTRGVMIVNNNNLERNILRGIGFSAILLAICYIFIMGNTVFNIVERKALEADARELANEVGELELQYLNISKNVDLALAEVKGFKETETKKFATRKSLGSISFANNEL